MILDDTLKEIIEEVRQLVKTKYKKDLSTEQLFKIIKTQIDITIIAISKNISVHWKGMGKFLFNSTLKRDKDFNSLFEKMESDDYNLSVQEKIDLKKNLILEKAKEKDINLYNQRHGKVLTAKELIDTPDVQKIQLKVFKNLT